VSFGGTLLGGTLPGRQRELAILRTAVRCGAEYEWSHHAGTARNLGVSDEELSGLRQPLDAHPWSAPDHALLRAVDEMHDTWALSDEAWAPLHERFGDAGVIELVMLVGQYHLVALALRVLRVQDEGA